MNRTRKNLLRVYADITAYAASKMAQYGLPRCDLGDIVAEAYVKAQAKMPRYAPRKNSRELLKTIAWSEVMNELKRRNRIAALHDKYDLRLDAPKPTEDGDGENDDGPENDGTAISDEGKGAETIRSFDEPDEEATPMWVYDCRAREAELNHKPRDIVRAFKKLWDPAEVMTKVKLGEKQFGAFLKKIQNHFDQCFQAYHAWLTEKALRVE